MLPPSAERAAVVFFGVLAGQHHHRVADAQLRVPDATVVHHDRLAQQLRAEHLGVPVDRGGRIVGGEIRRE